MATLSVLLNGYPDIPGKLLLNELNSYIEQLDKDASVIISITEGGSTITLPV